MDKLGEGGMGVVYLDEDTKLEKLYWGMNNFPAFNGASLLFTLFSLYNNKKPYLLTIVDLFSMFILS